MPLTDIAVKTATATDRQIKIFDSEVLYLLVTPEGGKRWRLKYYFGGKEKHLALGVYPAVSLKEARARRYAARELLSQGIDLGEQRKQEKKAHESVALEQGRTFEVVAREWYSKKTTSYTVGHRKKILLRLEKQLFPYIGSIPFSQLEPADILGAVRHAEERGVMETAHRLAQLAGQVSRYAKITGDTKYNLAAGISEALPAVPKKHYATITDPKEVAHLLRAIDDYSGGDIIAYALRLLPYVFVRSGELRGARWEEFDLEAAEWVIPASRMKMKRPHLVPLAKQVVTLLENLNDLTGGGEYLFPGYSSRTRNISDMGLLNALRRLGYTKEQMTIHGFRSLASTLLNEQGYRGDVIEAQLAHGERNAIRAAYNHAEYLPERRAMMQDGANYLDSLKSAT